MSHILRHLECHQIFHERMSKKGYPNNRQIQQRMSWGWQLFGIYEQLDYIYPKFNLTIKAGADFT